MLAALVEITTVMTQTFKQAVAVALARQVEQAAHP
jgi:hypothetical protein